MKLFENLVTLTCHLISVVSGILKLSSDVVDVPLESQDLLYVILFFLLMLLDCKGSTANFFLGILHLRVQILVLSTDSLDGVLEALNLKAGVAVVSQNVFFLDLESPDSLLGALLLVKQLIVLRLEHIVGMRTLSKLLIDEPVLPCQRLDVLSHLGDLLSLQLGKMRLLLQLLFEILKFLAQYLDLLFSLEKLSLIAVFFAHYDAHLVLDVAEVEALLLQLLLHVD